MEHPSDVYEVLRQISMSYGVPKLASQMGVSTGTLYNKLNLNDSSQLHKPTLADFTQIVSITHSTAPLQALCMLFSGVFYRLPDVKDFPNEALLEIVNQVHIKSGDVHGVMQNALSDGVVTPDEVKSFDKECQQWLAAILELKARFAELSIQVKK